MEEAMGRGCQFEVDQVSQVGIGQQFMLVQVIGDARVVVLDELYLRLPSFVFELSY